MVVTCTRSDHCPSSVLLLINIRKLLLGCRAFYVLCRQSLTDCFESAIHNMVKEAAVLKKQKQYQHCKKEQLTQPHIDMFRILKRLWLKLQLWVMQFIHLLCTTSTLVCHVEEDKELSFVHVHLREIWLK